MAHDPVADDADAAVLDWETGLPPIKHEDLPRMVQQKIAAELTRIRFELSALRKRWRVARIENDRPCPHEHNRSAYGTKRTLTSAERMSACAPNTDLALPSVKTGVVPTRERNWFYPY
jgi:hypothetical protein